MSGHRIIVTGSSGTIGTRLCERLLADGGCTVRGVDWRPNPWSQAVQEITTLADLRDPVAVERMGGAADLVVHLAANARVYDLVVEPAKARDNLLTVYNTLEHCRRHGIPRFVFASSREVYGNTGKALHGEPEAHVDHAESPYSASKLAGEALVRSYQQCYGLDFVIFRFSNVYGMYDDSDRVVPQFIRQTQAGEDLTVFGRDKLLDFTYIDDAVDGVLLALQRFAEARNEAYNLACGVGTTILEVAEAVREHLGATNAIHLGEPRTGEVVQYVADIGKARERLGFDPKVSFREGIARSVAWYKANLPR